MIQLLWKYKKTRPLVHLLWKLFYERDVARFYNRHAPYDVSVDIGAGIGIHTKKLAKVSNKVIAIEPLNELVNMPDNVEFHKVAVGRKRGTKEMIFDDGYYYKVGNFAEGFPTKPRENVKVVLLDDIVTEADFLKIDVEGYELEVLEPSSILNSVNYVVIELHNVEHLSEVKSLLDYQIRIFKLLKDFRVFVPELKSHVSLSDVPLTVRKDQKGKLQNNYHLLCVREGMGE